MAQKLPSVVYTVISVHPVITLISFIQIYGEFDLILLISGVKKQ